MSAMTLSKLVEKLSPSCKRSLESAASICHSRSQFTVEIEHWLLAMLESELGDITLICNHFSVDKNQLTDELRRGLEGFKTGNSAAPSLSPHIVNLLRQTWLNTSIEFGDNAMRSAYLIFTLLQDDSLSALVSRSAKQLLNIDSAKLLMSWPELNALSDEQQPVNSSDVTDAQVQSATPSLAQFTQDLTAQAKSGKIDPILGRDNEIRQMIDILTRRRQNNPILTGEAGVGKTAVVEGLALKIAQQDVPDALKMSPFMY